MEFNKIWIRVLVATLLGAIWLTLSMVIGVLNAQARTDSWSVEVQGDCVTVTFTLINNSSIPGQVEAIQGRTPNDPAFWVLDFDPPVVVEAGESYPFTLEVLEEGTYWLDFGISEVGWVGTTWETPYHCNYGTTSTSTTSSTTTSTSTTVPPTSSTTTTSTTVVPSTTTTSSTTSTSYVPPTECPPGQELDPSKLVCFPIKESG